MTTDLCESLDEGILRLTLNRPQNRNALSLAMIESLQKALNHASQNKLARVIILGANGPAFCAGHDLKEITTARQSDDGGKSQFSHLMKTCSHLMQTIISHRLPIIADIRGPAAAAGCQLVASCDLAIATHQAKFSTPGVHIGLFCSTPMVALSRNVSRKHAMEMLLAGDAISAKKAEQIGLINEAVGEHEISETIQALANQIVAKSAMTLAVGKSAFYKQAQMSLAEAYDYTAGIMVENLMKNDAHEGIDAFLEKRNPNWIDE